MGIIHERSDPKIEVTGMPPRPSTSLHIKLKILPDKMLPFFRFGVQDRNDFVVKINDVAVTGITIFINNDDAGVLFNGPVIL